MVAGVPASDLAAPGELEGPASIKAFISGTPGPVVEAPFGAAPLGEAGSSPWRPLSDRRHNGIWRKRMSDSVFEPKSNKTCAGRNDCVEFAIIEFLQTCINVATNVFDRQIIFQIQ